MTISQRLKTIGIILIIIAILIIVIWWCFRHRFSQLWEKYNPFTNSLNKSTSSHSNRSGFASKTADNNSASAKSSSNSEQEHNVFKRFIDNFTNKPGSSSTTDEESSSGEHTNQEEKKDT